MKLTRHAAERASERMGLNTKALARTAAKALSKGLAHADTKGSLNRYLSRLFLAQRKADNMRIHGEHIYLFAGESLITILHLPHEHKAAARRAMQRKGVEA